MNGTVFTPPAVNVIRRVNGYLLGNNHFAEKETTMSRNVSDITQMILFRPESHIWENGTDEYGHSHSLEVEYPKKHFDKISPWSLKDAIWRRIEEHWKRSSHAIYENPREMAAIKAGFETIPDAVIDDLATVMQDVEKTIPRKDIVMTAWYGTMSWNAEAVFNVWFRYKETDLVIFKVEYRINEKKWIEDQKVEIKMMSPCVVQNGGLTHLDVEYMQADALYRQTFQTYAASSEESFVASWKGMQKWEAKMRETYKKTVLEAQALEKKIKRMNDEKQNMLLTFGKKANNIARACNIEM